MKVLLIGNGAREHIIAEKIAAEAELYAVMSQKNPGIARLAKKSWICNIEKPDEIVKCVKDESIDIAFASPDAVLAAGASDALQKAGILVASPLKEAARIEWDKQFMRSIMRNHKVSCSVEWQIAENEQTALKAIKDLNEVAIKPIGLTGGKGVKVSGDHFSTIEEGMTYVREVLRKDGKVLIEEKVVGEEFSFQAFSDGIRISLMPPVQDHKRAFEKDLGPNTGGMGSYSTGKLLPFLEQSDLDKAKKAMQETIHAMKKEKRKFKGVLYGQFMATKDGVRIIEFNSRFGDPEAMNVLSLLKTSIVDIMLSIADEKIVNADFEEHATVVKYLVPNGYPDKPEAEAEISVDAAGINSISANSPKMINAKFYYASVNETGGKVYTSKSRAVGMVGIGPNLQQAEYAAELACSFVKGPVWHRKDIGTKDLIDKRIEHMQKLRGKKNEG